MWIGATTKLLPARHPTQNPKTLISHQGISAFSLSGNVCVLCVGVCVCVCVCVCVWGGGGGGVNSYVYHFRWTCYYIMLFKGWQEKPPIHNNHLVLWTHSLSVNDFELVPYLYYVRKWCHWNVHISVMSTWQRLYRQWAVAVVAVFCSTNTHTCTHTRTYVYIYMHMQRLSVTYSSRNVLEWLLWCVLQKSSHLRVLLNDPQ